ncbi:exopolyphosphatase [Idiomarina xiamenensis]|uniref:Exopolyphosphatase n=1 Tax=Idiomarina xiamenensis 10-D-4 TaxID=740709 RepID=K2KYK4_9GAMM|nr:exopolyphosphatase [Idiomarina xiamenensis]EKE87624.1 exopolyphosphatase [Idiomarina xiamenensis 10-D-4]
MTDKPVSTAPEHTANESHQTQAAEQFAALDLGSNSFHLITARVVDGALQPLLKLKQPVQLGAGMDDKQSLSQQAMQRGFEALHICAQRLQGFAPEQVRVVATHTLRKASNGREFLQRAATILPYPIEVISGHEEARLIYQGVAQTVAGQATRMVIDIGGGSTELIVGDGSQARFVASRSMGCVSFTEQFFANGKISKKRFHKAVVAAQREVEPLLSQLNRYDWTTVIGTSGTIKTIAAVVKDCGWSEGGITHASLLELQQWLLTQGHADALTHKAIAPERQSVMAAGCAILLAIFNELELDYLSEHDAALREGVLYELAAQQLQGDDVRQRTIDAIAKRYQVDENQAARVAISADKLFHGCQHAWALERPIWYALLSWAARLHEVGLHINSSGKHKHSAYILAHADLPGFNREQQDILAAIVRLQRKKLQPSALPKTRLYPLRQVQRLVAIIRLAVLVNQDRQSDPVIAKVHAEQDNLTLQLTPDRQQDMVLQADLLNERQQLAKLNIELLWA